MNARMSDEARQDDHWRARAERAEADLERAREALRLIAKGEPLRRYEWCRSIARDALAGVSDDQEEER